MNEFFDYSQQVKQRILARNDLIEIIGSHLSGGKRAEIISPNSTSSRVFRIGKLDDLCLAMRQLVICIFQPYMGAEDEVLACYEAYAQAAERYSAEGKRATSFCIGVIKDDNSALIVEDLTQGGFVTICKKNPFDDYGIVGSTGEKVYFDLTDDITEATNLRFMAEDSRINL